MIESKCLWCLGYFKIEFVIFKAIVPFIIMVFSSSLIIWKMSTRMNIPNLISNNKEKDLTKSLVIMDLSFILFQLPLILYLTFTTNNYDQMIFDPIYSLLYAIGFINIAISILVFIAFNKIFCNAFLKLIGKNNRSSRVSNHS